MQAAFFCMHKSGASATLLSIRVQNRTCHCCALSQELRFGTVQTLGSFTCSLAADLHSSETLNLPRDEEPPSLPLLCRTCPGRFCFRIPPSKAILCIMSETSLAVPTLFRPQMQSVGPH
jgi:hypothetical protein